MIDKWRNKVLQGDCLELIKQLPGEKIDLIICDPPYEFQNRGGGLYSLDRFEKKMSKIKELKINSFDFDKFIPKILDLQGNRVNAYFFCNKKLLVDYLCLAKKRNLIFDVLILEKTNPVPAFKNSYMNDLEYIVFLRSSGVTFNSNNGYVNYKKVYHVSIGNNNKYHPTEKPVDLIKKFIKNSSNKGNIVLDAFLGSGTTAVACKQLGRNFIGFELIEEYCDIARKRLEQEIMRSWF